MCKIDRSLGCFDLIYISNSLLTQETNSEHAEALPDQTKAEERKGDELHQGLSEFENPQQSGRVPSQMSGGRELGKSHSSSFSSTCLAFAAFSVMKADANWMASLCPGMRIARACFQWRLLNETSHTPACACL